MARLTSFALILALNLCTVLVAQTSSQQIDPIWLSPNTVGDFPETYPDRGIWTNISVGAGARRGMPLVAMDSKKTLWIMFGFDDIDFAFTVWNYDPKTDLYRRVAGANNSKTDLRNPGTLNVPSPDNWPGGVVYNRASIDHNDNIWFPSSYYKGELWMFNTTSYMFTRIQGLDGQLTEWPSYGSTPGQPGEDVWPGNLAQTCIVTDSKNNLWTIAGYDNNNRVWHFNTTSLLWTFIGGNQTYQPNTIFGKNPLYGSRTYHACDIDKEDRIWIFGGSSAATYNDVWSYDTHTTQMQLEYGSDASANSAALVVVADQFDPSNHPAAKNFATFVDRKDGTLLLVGGSDSGSKSANDVWLFNKTSKAWKLIYGDPFIGNPPGNFSNYRAPGSVLPGRQRHGSPAGLNINGDVFIYADDSRTNDIWVLPQDQCSLNLYTCGADAHCVEEMVGYSCQCDDGFVGDGYNCTVPIPQAPPVASPVIVSPPQSEVEVPEQVPLESPPPQQTPNRDSQTAVSGGEKVGAALLMLTFAGLLLE